MFCFDDYLFYSFTCDYFLPAFTPLSILKNEPITQDAFSESKKVIISAISFYLTNSANEGESLSKVANVYPLLKIL
jgi:hypothetical protein